MTCFYLSNSKIKINILFILMLFLLFLCGYIEYAIISFFIVIIHECAHSLVSILLGYKIEEIEIFPLGGVVKLDKLIGVNPQHEILIAGAGPISNIIMALIAYILIINYNLNHDLIIYFAYANVVITITNLLPLLPLDGGRIARGYLSYLIGMKNSTKVLINFSKFASVLIFILGIYLTRYNKMNIFVCFVAIFLFSSIKKEKEMAVFIFMREITAKKQYLFNKGVIKTKQLVAVNDTSIKKVIDSFRPQKYHFITVVDKDCNVLGILTESDIVEGIFEYGLNAKLELLISNKKYW